MSLSKKRKLFRYQAMTSAAEMIRSINHSNDEAESLYGDDLELFDSECDIVAQQIELRAENFRKKHNL